MSEPVVETRDLSMRFGGVLAVNHVNFTLRERELRCLIGPNGAGKSTFFKCLTGQIRMSQCQRPRLHPRPGRDRLARLRDRAARRRHQDAGALGDERPDRAGRTSGCRRAASTATTAPTPRSSDVDRRARPRRHRAPRRWASSRTVSARWSRSASCSRSSPWLVLLDEPAAGITGAETERLVAHHPAASTRRRRSSSSTTTCSSCACSVAGSRCCTRARS